MLAWLANNQLEPGMRDFTTLSVWQKAHAITHARDSLGSANELSCYLILAHDLGIWIVRYVTIYRAICPRSVECSHR